MPLLNLILLYSQYHYSIATFFLYKKWLKLSKLKVFQLKRYIHDNFKTEKAHVLQRLRVKIRLSQLVWKFLFIQCKIRMFLRVIHLKTNSIYEKKQCLSVLINKKTYFLTLLPPSCPLPRLVSSHTWRGVCRGAPRNRRTMEKLRGRVLGKAPNKK